MMSCTDKHYHHAISIKSSSIFWSQLVKCPPVNLCLCLAWSQKSNEWQLQKIRLATIPSCTEKKPTKIPVTYGRNPVSDLASSNDVATNGVMVKLATKPGANVNAVPW